MGDSARDAYVAGLTMLARRELSEMQLRQRLTRRGHADEDVEAAIQRLKQERALDDARVAEAIVRTEAGIRRRGRVRAARRLQGAGIEPTTARHALENVYTELDPDALITAALDRRLRERGQILDAKEFQRLYRFLIGQGFEPDHVLRVLRGRAKSPEGDDDR